MNTQHIHSIYCLSKFQRFKVFLQQCPTEEHPPSHQESWGGRVCGEPRTTINHAGELPGGRSALQECGQNSRWRGELRKTSFVQSDSMTMIWFSHGLWIGLIQPTDELMSHQPALIRNTGGPKLSFFYFSKVWNSTCWRFLNDSNIDQRGQVRGNAFCFNSAPPQDYSGFLSNSYTLSNTMSSIC